MLIALAIQIKVKVNFLIALILNNILASNFRCTKMLTFAVSQQLAKRGKTKAQLPKRTSLPKK